MPHRRDSPGEDASARVAATLLLLSLLAVATLFAALLTGAAGSPAITATENRIAGGDDATTVVQSDVTVTNPNPVTVPPGGAAVSYRIAADGEPLGEGTVHGVRFPPGDSTVTVRTPVANRRIGDWVVDHLRAGERTTFTYERTVRDPRFDRTLSRKITEETVETDVTGTLEVDDPRPVEAGLAGVDDPVLYVNESTARWTNVTDDRSTMVVNATVYNPTATRIPTREATVGVSLNDVALAEGATTDLEPIPAGEERNVTARLVVDNGNLTEWWATHARANQTSSVRVEYAVRLSVLGSLTTTVEPDPIERTLHTDVFGDPGERVRVTDGSVGDADTERGPAVENESVDGPNAPSSRPRAGGEAGQSSAVSSRSTRSSLPTWTGTRWWSSSGSTSSSD